MTGLVRCANPWTQPRPPALRDCRHPWERLDVTRHGEALVCCYTQEVLGNIVKDGLEAVLAGSRRAQVQRDVRRNRLHPACFNAPCPYAPGALARPWRVHFPADRFTGPAALTADGRLYHPAAGDGPFTEGPARFLPPARMEAHLGFSFPRRVLPFLGQAGHITAELIDGTGEVHTQASAAVVWRPRLRLRLPFTLVHPPRQRFSLRLAVQGVSVVLLFRGLTLRGWPLD